jgi:hypothetical protein
MAVPYTFGSATTSIPLSQLDSNFATTITLGNTAVQLGNTITTLTGVSNVASAGALTLGSNGNTTALTIATNQAITVANTGNGITYSSSGGSGLRIYGAGGTHQWDLYLNGANIRLGDNTGGGAFQLDSNLNFGSSNGGIVFNNSSALTNSTLNDYETGSWTPQPSFNGGTTGMTLSTQAGTYVKIGKAVILTFRISFTNKGSSTGSFGVLNLPFSSATGAANYSAATIGYASNLANAANWTTYQYLNVDSGTTNLNFRYALGGGATDHNQGNINNNSDIIVQCTYVANF